MLNKIFGNKNFNNLSLNPFHARASASPSGPVDKWSRALKIVHLGGRVEYYYMAIPASRIIEKYPSFVLTRPEIFRRPWDAIVRPDETLVPGQKYYVVPRQTVRKLRRRIRKISGMNPGFSFESKSSVEDTPHDKNNISISTSTSGILVKPGPKIKARNRHVRFFGIETIGLSKGDKGSKERLRIPQLDEKHRRARNENAWEPSLNAINE
ncbi:hypothetical protein BUALT_Bualt03G0225100 [Buddleja alternifolia]|uniref:Uncharacterized protein n=1 Tax=Buddleja alternifolia TaxID=168488 RepID=A0AAV6XXM1_9LAMI|nr:hypothetical protein BUALT_Bualt03G0225100 [Buddleja alternifolia]